MALQANSTFLPILDDLLSPEFRPVLQTPTSCAATPKTFGAQGVFNTTYTNGNAGASKSSKGVKVKGPNRSQSVPAQLVNHVSNDAASKIQNWWRRRNNVGENSSVDLRAERAKHSIRHTRTEAHVQHLENEVKHLKTALSTEKKLRSLQLEAIRSLWSQVQRISTPGATDAKPDDIRVGIMSQSMPNGLPTSNSPRKKALLRDNMSISYAGEVLPEDDPQSSTRAGCTSACAKEIENLKETLSSEISQLREMIAKLRTAELPNSETETVSTNATSAAGNPSDSTDDKEIRPPVQAQRPVSLNVVSRGNQSQVDTQELLSELPEAEEIVDYASQMASKLLEDAVEGEDKEIVETVSEKSISPGKK